MTTTPKTKTPKPLSPQRVAINSEDYHRAHLRHPRGAGAWGFCPEDKFKDLDYLAHVIWVRGAQSFTEAAKSARERAAAQGIRRLIVCP